MDIQGGEQVGLGSPFRFRYSGSNFDIGWKLYGEPLLEDSPRSHPRVGW